ncbi:MAG: DUF5688 family protein [Muricoprocola sp.]
MKYEDFVCILQTKLKEKLGGEVYTSLRPITKNNGIVLDGLAFKEKGSKVAPTVYLNEMYKEYQNGMSVPEIVEEIVQIYQMSKISPEFDAAFYTDFEKVRNHLACKLIHKEKNEELLKNVPHREFLNLAIVVYYRVEHPKIGNGAILVYESHRKMWNVTEEELLRIAKENTRKIMPECLMAIEPLLDLEDEEQMGIPMYVLTNESIIYGAVYMIYDSVLEKIGKILDDDFWLLPSSIHEMIIVPKKSGAYPDELRDIVCEINETEIPQEDILSDEIYEYDAKMHRLKVVP